MKFCRSPCSALLVAPGALAWNFASENSFRESLSSRDFSLVAFVAPTLDSSKAFEPEWKAIEEGQPSALSVDCIADAKLCSELDVASFPTVRFYHKDGSMRRYRGPRKAKQITSFLNRIARPVVSQPQDDAALQTFLTSDDYVFLATIREDLGDADKLEERFEDLATRYQDRFSFGMTKAKGGDAPAGVRCNNNFDGLQYASSELGTVESLELFLKKCTTPLIPEMTRRNEMEYLSSGKSLVYFFSPDDAERAAYVDTARPMTRKYAQFLTFVTVDSAAYPEMVSGLGIPGGEAGVGVSVSNPRMGQIFPLAGSQKVDSVTKEALDAFIVAISEGKVQPWDGVLREAAQDGHDEL